MDLEVDLGEKYLKGDGDIGCKRLTDAGLGVKGFRGDGESRRTRFVDVFSGVFRFRLVSFHFRLKFKKDLLFNMFRLA